jgi:hypothetical protein
VILAASPSAFDQPGTLGFLVVFGMGVILYFVFRSMVRHLRKVNTAAALEAARAEAAEPGQSTAADGTVFGGTDFGGTDFGGADFGSTDFGRADSGNSTPDSEVPAGTPADGPGSGR